MAVSQAQIITFNSITVLGVNATNAVDRTQPLSFIQWLPYNKATYSTPEKSLVQYQQYLTNWYTVQGASVQELSNAVQYLYVNLINEIIINYSTVDEQRYLSNLDFTNSRDLAIAIPFFAKKIKDVCLYYTTLRETAQTATTQYNLKGSNIGVKTLLYNTISNALQSQDLTTTINTLNLSLSSIRNNMVLSIESIYDTTPDYFDVSPLSATALSASASTSTRQIQDIGNQPNIDPFLTLNFSQSIVNAILQYPIFAAELGLQVAINPAVQATQLNLLKDSDYINNINTGSITDLNLNTIVTTQEKYIGADFYYIITDSTLTTYTSGQLFAANSEFANVLNKRFPTIAAVPSKEFLKTGKDVGLFFKPDKIGLLHFTNFSFVPSVNLAKLQPNTVYYFPDPSKYGNVTSNTQQNFVTPFTFFENNYFNKIDFSNQYRFGEVGSEPYHQLFRSYQSREQTLEYSNLGISRYTDYQDFFTGGLDTIWNNIDVYNIAPTGEYPVDQRTQELLTIDSTLFQFKSDVYGNQYGLYKPTSNVKAPLSSSILPENNVTDLVLDNNNFVYTSTLIPDNIISGGYFNPLSGYQPTINVQSYGFKFEAFATDYVSSNFIINISDCESYISPSGQLWVDSESDFINYNPYLLYYNTLVECGITNTGQPAYSGSLVEYISAGVPTVSGTSLSATFLYPSSGFPVYDGYWFVVDYYDNNLNVIRDYDPFTPQQYTYEYIEPSTFVTNRIPGLSSTLDFSLTGENIDLAIYDQRNNTYGTLYCRLPDSSLIAPFSAALSSIYTKYTTISSYDNTTGSIITIGNEINTECVNFDVYYDVLQIETSNHLIFDKIRFNSINNAVYESVTYSYLYCGSNPSFEKFSNVWFDEQNRQLIVCQTKLYTTVINNVDPLSATNYKTIYPKIYVVNLNTPNIIQLYPYTSDQTLPLSSVIQYSLSGTNINTGGTFSGNGTDGTLNIIEVEKPVLTFNSTTDVYDLSFLSKDTANAFYTTNIKFKYINGVLTIVSNTLYKPLTDTLHQTFATYKLSDGTLNTVVSPTLNGYNIIGSNIGTPSYAIPGYIDVYDSTYTFGNYASTSYLLAQPAVNSSYPFIVLQDDTTYISL